MDQTIKTSDMTNLVQLGIPGVPVAELPAPSRFVIDDEFVTESRRPPKLDSIKEEDKVDLVSPKETDKQYKGILTFKPIPEQRIQTVTGEQDLIRGQYQGQGYQARKEQTEPKITKEMYDSLGAFIWGTEIYCIDMINGFAVPPENVHELYKKTLRPQPMKPVTNIFQITRIGDKFVVVLLSGEDMNEINVIYDRKTHIFHIVGFNPCVIIPAILKNPDFELYFMACEHPMQLRRNYSVLYRKMSITTYDEYIKYMRESFAEHRRQQHGVSYDDIYEDKEPGEISSYARATRDAVGTGAGSDGEDEYDDDDSYEHFHMHSPSANDDRPVITDEELKEVEDLFKPSASVDEYSGDTGRKGPVRDLHKRPYMGSSPYLEDASHIRTITEENERMLEVEIRQELEKRRQLLGDRYEPAVQRQLVLRSKLAQLEELERKEAELFQASQQLRQQTNSLKQQLAARSQYLQLKSKEEEEIEAAIKLSLETQSTFNLADEFQTPLTSEMICPVPPPQLPEREDNL